MVLIFIYPALIQSQDVNDKSLTKELNEIVSAYRERDHFSGTVLVVKEGHVLLRQAYGMASVVHGVRNAPITRLNQAQTDLVRAEANLASARINVLNARAQLDAAIGVADNHVAPEED
jgi:outer membrane protein TolC